MTDPGSNGDREFVRITNRDIWAKLTAIEYKVDSVLISRTEQLQKTSTDHEGRIRKLEVRLPSIVLGAMIGIGVVLKVGGVI